MSDIPEDPAHQQSRPPAACTGRALPAESTFARPSCVLRMFNPAQTLLYQAAEAADEAEGLAGLTPVRRVPVYHVNQMIYPNGPAYALPADQLDEARPLPQPQYAAPLRFIAHSAQQLGFGQPHFVQLPRQHEQVVQANGAEPPFPGYSPYILAAPQSSPPGRLPQAPQHADQPRPYAAAKSQPPAFAYSAQCTPYPSTSQSAQPNGALNSNAKGFDVQVVPQQFIASQAQVFHQNPTFVDEPSRAQLQQNYINPTMAGNVSYSIYQLQSNQHGLHNGGIIYSNTAEQSVQGLPHVVSSQIVQRRNSNGVGVAEMSSTLFDNAAQNYTADWVSRTSSIPPEQRVPPDVDEPVLCPAVHAQPFSPPGAAALDAALRYPGRNQDRSWNEKRAYEPTRPLNSQKTCADDHHRNGTVERRWKDGYGVRRAADTMDGAHPSSHLPAFHESDFPQIAPPLNPTTSSAPNNMATIGARPSYSDMVKRGTVSNAEVLTIRGNPGERSDRQPTPKQDSNRNGQKKDNGGRRRRPENKRDSRRDRTDRDSKLSEPSDRDAREIDHELKSRQSDRSNQVRPPKTPTQPSHRKLITLRAEADENRLPDSILSRVDQHQQGLIPGPSTMAPNVHHPISLLDTNFSKPPDYVPHLFGAYTTFSTLDANSAERQAVHQVTSPSAPSVSPQFQLGLAGQTQPQLHAAQLPMLPQVKFYNGRPLQPTPLVRFHNFAVPPPNPTQPPPYAPQAAAAANGVGAPLGAHLQLGGPGAAPARFVLPQQAAGLQDFFYPAALPLQLLPGLPPAFAAHRLFNPNFFAPNVVPRVGQQRRQFVDTWLDEAFLPEEEQVAELDFTSLAQIHNLYAMSDRRTRQHRNVTVLENTLLNQAAHVAGIPQGDDYRHWPNGEHRRRNVRRKPAHDQKSTTTTTSTTTATTQRAPDAESKEPAPVKSADES